MRRVAPASSLSTLPESATATFSIVYIANGDTDAYGEPCSAFPEAAKTAFEAAAAIWGNIVSSPVPITIQSCWADLGSSTTLGYSGGGSLHRDFNGAPMANTYYSAALANSLNGSDLDSSNADMHITYNRNFNWYFGTDGNPSGNQHDLMTVVLHEIGHGLNFSGSMRYANGIGSWGYGTGFPNIYDTFIHDGSGTRLLDNNGYPNGSTTLGSALISNNLWFHGPQAMSANGGQPVRIYSPSSWSPGSSYSHLDYTTFNNTLNQLMVYAVSAGEVIHDPGIITSGLLEDLGWVNSTILATVTTETVTSIGTLTAIGNGTITTLGIPNPTSYGVCWNTTGTPVITESCSDEGNTITTGPFTSLMSQLTPDTAYYVRAYATNSAGTSYGNQVSFTTAMAPVISIGDALDNSTLTWTTGGNATWTGQAVTFYAGGDAAQSGTINNNESSWVQTTVTGPGTLTFYWKVSSEFGFDFLRFSINDVEQAGAISGTVDWQQKTYTFIPSGTYTLKWSYTKDQNGTAGSDTGWLDNVVFSENPSPTLPGVTTQAVTSIKAIAATANGTLTSLGSPNPHLHGVCWNTTGSPTTADTCSDEGVASTNGTFTTTMIGLSPGTVYFVRAYATNSAGTAYGDEVSFKTTKASLLSIGEAVDNALFTFTSGGNANWFGQTSTFFAEGDAAQSGTISNNENSWLQTTVNGPGTLKFYWKISSERYYDYLRFYINDIEQPDAIHGLIDWQQKTYIISTGTHTIKWVYTKDHSVSGGSDTGWLDKITFTAATPTTLPKVTTGPVTAIGTMGATGNGTLASLGTPSPNRYGVCWNTSGNPTTVDSCSNEGAAFATGAFITPIFGLVPATTYYVRAYATNNTGTAYGNQKSFRTTTTSPFPWSLILPSISRGHTNEQQSNGQ